MKNPHENTSITDDPLSQSDESVWNQYFGDQELFGVIRQDVVRTFPGIEFFRKDTVQDSMSKILFFYAREHPYMCYRQGMHEILGPIFFTRFSNQKYLEHIKEMTDDIDKLLIFLLDPDYIEHDTYAIFSRVMSAIGSYYRINNLIPTPDGYFPPQEVLDINEKTNSEAEVISQLNYIRDNILKKEDQELYQFLMKMEIPLQIFGIRWLRLLFGREFALMDLLVLWDAIFADGDKFELPNYILVAMLIRIRDFLLHNDYTTCLTYLMKYPSNVDINLILKHALYMYFPKPLPINPVPSGQVKYQKKQVKQLPALPRSRNNSLPESSTHKKPPTTLSDLQIQQAKKMAKINHLQSTTGANGLVINGISENSKELMSLELRHAQDIILITQHKLSQYLTTFRKHINRNHSEELNQAVEGIEELCALLDVKFTSTNDVLTAPVDAALEANEEKKRERSSSLVEPHPKVDESKRSSSSESERAKYEIPDIKDSSKLFGRKKSVEMKTFLSDWQQIEVEEDSVPSIDPLGALNEHKK
ncbi:TBC1D5 family protein [Megaselia abdita]